MVDPNPLIDRKLKQMVEATNGVTGIRDIGVFVAGPRPGIEVGGVIAATVLVFVLAPQPLFILVPLVAVVVFSYLRHAVTIAITDQEAITLANHRLRWRQPAPGEPIGRTPLSEANFELLKDSTRTVLIHFEGQSYWANLRDVDAARRFADR